MDNETTGRTTIEDEIDLRELFWILWEGKLTLMLVTALSAVISVLVALNVPNKGNNLQMSAEYLAVMKET